MPVSKEKPTTSTPELAMPEPSSPVLPDQQVFHQHLRTLAQSAVRIVLETVMREELDQFIGASWGECSTAMASTPATSLPRLVGLSRSTCRETAPVSPTRRPLSATVAMNRTSPRDSPRCSWLGPVPIR